ncbi:efflux transporter outer membrane subunit [Novosphingobium album (ex Liu et al. 2023)]|uniref:Efflux transporter outer membrane subunit n=1 Tax=Novosphingobium album (ex Liu et al. 2023) TaxID=3031130 RepID=A0ABT5WX08_9SPHN|nr:efflux transporter outer membrane subunit [Novosphingobium album (ex Liu et al. 2023)]MDE8654435.1 efflux transporter outer membrane subunit [Novosphingobium album (ex Liu et al. 2023)]
MSTNISLRVAAGSILALAAGLAGCTAPDLGARPDMRAPATLESARSLAGSAGRQAAEWPRERWWTAYGDPQIDALVDEALAASPDVAAAAARIRQARGAAEMAGAEGLPQISGQGSTGATKQSYNNGVPAEFVPRGWKSTGTLALSGEFDLDLWGKTRAALAAATSETQAAEADAHQAALMLSTNVVSSYFDLARLIERDKAFEAALAARETVAELTQRRVAQGLDNQSPLRQARAAVASARVDLAANREQIALRRHALAALLGAGPDRGLAITPTALASLPETPIPADAGIALAGRRPDIVAARLRAQAAGSRIDSARAAFMPDISLRGLIGLTSLGLSNLVDSGSTYGNAGAALTLPVFEGGRLRGQFRQARGGYDEAVAAYNDTVISALRDVADAIASRDAAEAQERDTRQAQTDAEAAYALALQRYRGGLSSYLEVLSAQQAALAAREAAIDAHFRTLAREVALKRALGGGFVDATNEEASPT